MLKAKSKAKPVQTLSAFLKSNPEALRTTHSPRLTLKDQLPDFSMKPLMGITTEKDYIVSNAVENILAVPKKISLSEVAYCNKPEYGCIPKYICRIKEDIKRENEEVEKRKRDQEAAENAKRRLLEKDERNSILKGLRARWGDVNSKYQQITHMTVLDTLGKIRRKEHFETELKQIEKDIALMERSEDIYIDLER